MLSLMQLEFDKQHSSNETRPFIGAKLCDLNSSKGTRPFIGARLCDLNNTVVRGHVHSLVQGFAILRNGIGFRKYGVCFLKLMKISTNIHIIQVL